MSKVSFSYASKSEHNFAQRLIIKTIETLTGKKRIEKVFEYYETYRVNNKLPVTYEVIYGHAWQPVSKKNEQSIKLDDIKKQLTK